MEIHLERHVDMGGSPRRVLRKHVSGRTFLRGKWQPCRNGETLFRKRQMGRWAMFRGHLTRLIGDLEDVEESTRPDILRRNGELRNVDNEWVGCVDESRDGAKEPLLGSGEWLQIERYNINELGNMGRFGEIPHMGSGTARA